LSAGREEDLRDTRKELNQTLLVNWSDKIDKYYGLTVHHNPQASTYTLTAEGLIDKMLEMSGMANCTPCSTPMDVNLVLQPREETEAKAQPWYTSVVGALNYLQSMARPDLSFAANALSAYMSDPGASHEQALKRVMRYVKGTRMLGISFRGHGDMIQPPLLHAAADASHPSSSASMGARPVMGWMAYHGVNAISWATKRIHRICHSVADAELIAMKAVTKELDYTVSLLEEIGLGKVKPVEVQADNAAAITDAMTGKITSDMKHMGGTINLLHQAVTQQLVTFEQTPSVENVADLFTKPLCAELFKKHRAALGMQEPA
jgi:hypothetical protein